MYNNKSTTILAALVCMVLATLSCSEGTKALYDGEDGFSFAAPVLYFEACAEDEGVIKVPVYRSSLNVNMAEVALTDTSGKFTLTTKRVVFSDHSYTSYAQIRYSDISIFGLSGKFGMTLNIKSPVTPSAKGETAITASRKLTMKLLGDCTYFDTGIFDYSYETTIYKAEEGEVYRVMDPYSKGLVAEEYAQNGWMSNPPQYIQFSCDSNGDIYYEPFYTGMKVNGSYEAWCIYPSEYKWGKDFSAINAKNKRISEKVFQLHPVYYLPSFQNGYLSDGSYPITVTVK